MLAEIADSLVLIKNQTEANLPFLWRFLAVLWGAYLLVYLTGGALLILGIIPRKWYGLPGILFAPFLHANFNHLFFNSIPLVVLGNFILISGLDYFLFVTLFITVMSGTLIWLFAKPGIHVGASALVTGYWGLLVNQLFQGISTTSIILGMVSIYYFAGIFLGIFPQKKGVSWEGHLFGLLSGIVLGFLLTKFHFSL